MNYQLILKVIYSFYEVAKRDFLIGYHFRVIQDFDEHIPRIADFWNLQLSGQLEKRENLPFNLINTHKPLKVKKAEIGRWLVLFEKNLDGYVSKQELSSEDKELWMQKVHHLREKLEGVLFN
jgi:truncated hemoglobin YjbI